MKAFLNWYTSTVDSRSNKDSLIFNGISDNFFILTLLFAYLKKYIYLYGRLSRWQTLELQGLRANMETWLLKLARTDGWLLRYLIFVLWRSIYLISGMSMFAYGFVQIITNILANCQQYPISHVCKEHPSFFFFFKLFWGLAADDSYT